MRTVILSLAAGVLISAAACVGAEKSADPLAPTVAGPIPGVSISAPTPVQPGQGIGVPVDQQPVTLVVQNASTTGVRPLTYSIDIATDSGFTNIVFSRQGITPAAGGSTPFVLPDSLATGHMYYWRAKAEDGANSSGYSFVGFFSVYTPIVIGQPAAISPANNDTTSSLTPQFSIGSPHTSGPAGPITFYVEVSTTSSFSSTVTTYTVAEAGNPTTFTSPGAFAASTQYFWHVRAADPTTIGSFSDTVVFKTPAAAAPPSGGGGGSTAGGPQPGDDEGYHQLFLSLVAGKPFGQQTLINLEPTLNSYGIIVTPPNGAGDRTKIGVPAANGCHDWFRVGFGEGNWVWVPEGNIC